MEILAESYRQVLYSKYGLIIIVWKGLENPPVSVQSSLILYLLCQMDPLHAGFKYILLYSHIFDCLMLRLCFDWMKIYFFYSMDLPRFWQHTDKDDTSVTINCVIPHPPHSLNVVYMLTTDNLQILLFCVILIYVQLNLAGSSLKKICLWWLSIIDNTDFCMIKLEIIVRVVPPNWLNEKNMPQDRTYLSM